MVWRCAYGCGCGCGVVAVVRREEEKGRVEVEVEMEDREVVYPAWKGVEAREGGTCCCDEFFGQIGPGTSFSSKWTELWPGATLFREDGSIA